MKNVNFLEMLKKYWMLIVAAGVLIAILASCYGFVNNTRNEGIAHERQLGAQYLDNQNWLSAYISGFYEKVGLVNAQSDAFDQIILNAVMGRYDDSGFSADGAFFAAVAEAYPDLSSLMASWNSIQDYITAGREGYRNQQSKLLDMLRVYDTWRDTGFMKSFVIRLLGFPSNRLEARVGNDVFTGELAREKMYQIVLTSQAIEAYESGTMEPLTIPSDN